MTTFWDLKKRSVFNMAPDQLRLGNILFSHKLQLKTTTGQSTETVYNFEQLNFTTSPKKCKIPNATITGMLQMKNGAEILLSLYCDHCIYSYNRLANETKPFAGKCSEAGFAEGTNEARLNNPAMISFGLKGSSYILFLDESNNALREIQVSSGKVSTVVKSENLTQPSRMAIDHATGNIFISTNRKIYRYSYQTNDLGLVAGTDDYSYEDGHFSTASFKSPRDMLLIDGGTKLLVAGDHDHSLRVLDLVINTTSSICSNGQGHSNGDIMECSFSNPFSLLVVNDTLFVGENGRIRQLEG